MWSALRNGVALSSSGSSDGYVSKARGWEFAPYSQSDREAARRRSGSPPPPAFLEQPTSDTQLHDLQIQHSRLKRRFEELRRRHAQEKDAWMKEKEMLLREMANLQGGENRRILLELKAVLDELQSEVKREECRRSELQLQYTKDRCEWELERAELKHRISQLEDQRKKRSCGDTLRMERETERRLLTDAQSAAVDPCCPTLVEHSERDWMRERSELLQRIHSERKEWESQLKDMQLKMEELLNELKTRGDQRIVESDTMRNYEEPRNISFCPGSSRNRSDSRSRASSPESRSFSNAMSEAFTPGSSRNLSDSRNISFSLGSCRNLSESRSRASSPESRNFLETKSKAFSPGSSRNHSESRSRASSPESRDFLDSKCKAYSPGSNRNLSESRSKASIPESRIFLNSRSKAFSPGSSRNLSESRSRASSPERRNFSNSRSEAVSPGSSRNLSDFRNIDFSPKSSRSLSESRSRASSPENRNLTDSNSRAFGNGSSRNLLGSRSRTSSSESRNHSDSRSRASSPESGNRSDSRSRVSTPEIRNQFDSRSRASSSESKNRSDSRTRGFSPGSNRNLSDSISRASSSESRNHSDSRSKGFSPESRNHLDFRSRAFGPRSSRNLSEAREELCSNCDEFSAQSESEIMGVAELEDILHKALDKELESRSILEEPGEHYGTTDSMALKAALQEIAMVSEELRSYQDPILVIPEVKRNSAESGVVPGEELRIEEIMFYRDLQASGMQNLTETTSRTKDEAEKKRDAAPPIPFRSASWYANTPWLCEVEPRVPGPIVYRRCESPCLHRKCNSPSIVKRFEAMLQENEGKILTDSGIGSAAVSQSSSSRWSCDGGRFSSTKSSIHVPFQKCLSEVNIPTADPPVRELYITDSLERHSPGPLVSSVRVSQRNNTLEHKTAEFNRVLFQVGQGLQSHENMPWPAESAPCLSPAHQIQQPGLDSTSRDSDPPLLTGDVPAMRLHSEPSGYSAGQSENLRNPGAQLELGSTVKPESLEEQPPAEPRFRNLPRKSRVLDESPWKPWTLAAYPRPTESRSNYGAIEQILKCYESSEPSPQDQQLQPSPGREEDLVELLKSLQVQNRSYSDHGSEEQPDQLHSANEEAPVVLKIQEPSAGAVKTFSRPACPTNRRPPSRWANRSSSASSTPSPSPPPMSQTALFSLSTFHTETVIM